MKIVYLLRRAWFSVVRTRKAPVDVRKRLGHYGRLPSSISALGAVANLPAAPTSWTSPRLKWGMLGNDQYGDCVFAGSAHAVMAVAKFLKISVTFYAQGVTKWYLNWDRGQDVGVVMDGFLRTWQDDTETSKEFYGYGPAAPFSRVDPTNVDQVKSCIATFGAVLVGANLQQAQEDQFSKGQMWDYVPGSPSVGGHCVALTGFNSVGPYVVSWGKGFRATWAWVTNCCDEAYTAVFPAALEAQKYVAPLPELDQYLSGLPPV